MRISDWSSDVCSSDLAPGGHRLLHIVGLRAIDADHHDGRLGEGVAAAVDGHRLGVLAHRCSFTYQATSLARSSMAATGGVASSTPMTWRQSAHAATPLRMTAASMRPIPPLRTESPPPRLPGQTKNPPTL